MIIFPFLLLPLLASAQHLSGRVSSVTGDKQCGTTMCVSATVNGSTVEYVLSSTGKKSVGWMAMGFGRQMANTPMVIMWLNSNGTITLSQRMAPQEVMPTVDSNPPRIATLSEASSVTSSSSPQFAYNILANSDTQQPIIYAFGLIPPSSSAKDATLVQHYDYGIMSLDLTKPLSAATGTATAPTAGSTSNSDSLPPGGDGIPLLPYQRVIIAHAILCVAGFLFFLPAGALLARYLRTFTHTWFTIHWIVQALLAGALIVIGVSLGVVATNKAGARHLDDVHKRWGVGIFVLYLLQCGFGIIIHFIKSKRRTARPPQNYIHATLGLVIIGLALYQVHDGYHEEWTKTTGRDPLPKVVNVLFFIWLVFLPVAYLAGLSLLPKQFRQENQPKIVNNSIDEDDDTNHFNMSRFSETPYRDY